eukprot:RCo052297
MDVLHGVLEPEAVGYLQGLEEELRHLKLQACGCRTAPQEVREPGVASHLHWSSAAQRGTRLTPHCPSHHRHHSRNSGALPSGSAAAGPSSGVGAAEPAGAPGTGARAMMGPSADAVPDSPHDLSLVPHSPAVAGAAPGHARWHYRGYSAPHRRPPSSH